MLTEIEDRLVEMLQEKVKEIPKENIVLNIEPAELPGLAISNLGFEFENLGLAENVDEGSVEVEESFRGDGVQASYKLKEKPSPGNVQVEYPPGTSLTEKKDFIVDYNEGSIIFRKAPTKDKNRILVKYLSQKRTMTVKGLKLKATYAVDVWGVDRVEADFIAEKVVKTLLTVEDELAAEGIELRPVGGETLREQGANAQKKTGRVRLKYVFERELRVKKLVPPIEKIEITSKNL